MDAEKVGRFICELRTRKGLTQNELAAKINVTNKAVSRWERGKGFPDISLLGPLAKELDVSILELLSGEYLKEEQKKEANLLLRTIQYIKQEQKNKREIISIVILLTIILIVFAIYYTNRFQGFDNRYLFKVINNIPKNPITSVYDSLKYGNIENFIKSSILSLCIISIQILYILVLFKKKKINFKTCLIINLAIELGKLFMLIGIFDISDILIRSIIVSAITKKHMKGGVVNEKRHYNCSNSGSDICR